MPFRLRQQCLRVASDKEELLQQQRDQSGQNSLRDLWKIWQCEEPTVIYTLQLASTNLLPCTVMKPVSPKGFVGVPAGASAAAAGACAGPSAGAAVTLVASPGAKTGGTATGSAGAASVTETAIRTTARATETRQRNWLRLARVISQLLAVACTAFYRWPVQ